MRHSIGIVAAVGLALLAAFVPSVQAAEGECLGRRIIQQRIDSGQLRQLSAAMSSAGVEGKIISSGAEVCMIDGQWQWRVNVMDANGESRPVTLPAE